MRKAVILLILFMFFTTDIIFSEAQLRSGFDKDGTFANRLRIGFGIIDFSLLAAVSNDGFEYLEPYIRTPVISLGRINLKGIVRELYNPDGTIPSSSVLIEASELRVTDSISRSSRYGVIVTPPAGFDLALWLFRTNAGIFSGGIEADGLGIIGMPFFSFDADLFISAGVYRGCPGDDWFEASRKLPEQAGLNAAAEVRLAAGSIRTNAESSEPGLELTRGDKQGIRKWLEQGSKQGPGRRVMVPDSSDFTAAVSVLGASSLPRYTGAGGLLRCLLTLGTEQLYCSGFFQTASDLYISPSGEESGTGLAAGAGLDFDTEFLGAELAGGGEYYLKRKKPQIIPSRFIAQQQNLSVDLKLAAGIFSTAINGSCRMKNEENGIDSLDADIDAAFGLDFGVMKLSTGGDVRFYDIGSFGMSRSAGWKAGLQFRGETAAVNIDGDYHEDEFELGAGFKIKSDRWNLFGGIDFKGIVLSGIAIGFETK